MPAKKNTAATKRAAGKNKGAGLNFSSLVSFIQQVHEQSAAAASRAVNVSLTLRNWLIGRHIIEYEQNGADRAEYGNRLLDRLAEALRPQGVSRVDVRELRRYRRFYLVYPHIRESVPPELRRLLPAQHLDTRKRRESVTPALGADAKLLISRLSFTHLAELIELDDPLKRAFYEIECIRSNWSVRALKRQIATLYFERVGLSKDKEKLAAMVQKGVETAEPKLAIRDPYIFEFLGLRAKDAVAESDLEAALVENLREFLLELGHGFCLEAQQKSIVIGKTRGFVDLVFYHRILKCHVLVELKVDEFKHEHLGQLNTYVSWYRTHMRSAGDNPPVGLLLCTGKDHALVQYATASMDNHLFVSKYAVELPTKAELEQFLRSRHLEMLGEA